MQPFIDSIILLEGSGIISLSIVAIAAARAKLTHLSQQHQPPRTTMHPTPPFYYQTVLPMWDHRLFWAPKGMRFCIEHPFIQTHQVRFREYEVKVFECLDHGKNIPSAELPSLLFYCLMQSTKDLQPVLRTSMNRRSRGRT